MQEKCKTVEIESDGERVGGREREVAGGRDGEGRGVRGGI